jgi:multimeric flavodoxin WrbA
MTMKIIGIQSSPKRKNSNTLKLLEAAMEGAREAGAETEIVDLTRLKIKYCTGCVTCYKEGYCHQKDDYGELKEKILKADGIILASPNYIDNITAQLKTFFDRSANFIHEQLLDGRYGFAVTTSGGGHDDGVLEIMNGFITRTGGWSTGGVGCGMGQGPAAMEAAIAKAHGMGKDLVAAIKEKRAYPDQAAAHKVWKDGFMNTLKRNKDLWKHNYECWVEKGWIKA